MNYETFNAEEARKITEQVRKRQLYAVLDEIHELSCNGNEVLIYTGNLEPATREGLEILTFKVEEGKSLNGENTYYRITW